MNTLLANEEVKREEEGMRETLTIFFRLHFLLCPSIIRLLLITINIKG